MAEPAAKSSTSADGTPAVGSPPLAPDGTPTCYVVDDEPSIRHFLSLVLHGAGVDTVEFPDGASMPMRNCAGVNCRKEKRRTSSADATSAIKRTALWRLIGFC